MRVPKLALRLGEGVVDFGGDHVFEPDETGVGFGGVVEEALSDIYPRHPSEYTV